MLSMKYEQGLSLYIYCLQDHVQIVLQTITPRKAGVFIWLYRQIILFSGCKFLLVHENLCALLEASCRPLRILMSHTYAQSIFMQWHKFH